MALRVTVTVPTFLEKQFEQLSTELGMSRQDTLLHCLTTSVTGKTQHSGPTAAASFSSDPEVPDLYMLAPPERLKVYTFTNAGSCLRGEELGEYHEINRGDSYAWLKFSRHSKQDAEGWEEGKNGKLCAACHPIAVQMWTSGTRSFV